MFGNAICKYSNNVCGAGTICWLYKCQLLVGLYDQSPFGENSHKHNALFLLGEILWFHRFLGEV